MRCEHFIPFLDGELPPEQAVEARLHLQDCRRCQRELLRWMQLEALGLALAESRRTRAIT
jgi:anti-sigma factor RsiW